ncbi:hypothetical protein ACLB2K_037337 [Fragaria x ananassa]
MKHLMSLLLDITCTDQPGVYLGLPTFWGRSKNGALAYIKEKVANKMDGWKEKVLTQAGKEVLIKSVTLAIPSFPMSCFRFPKGAVVNIWTDCWLPPTDINDPVRPIHTTGLIPSHAPIMVEEIIDWDTRSWHLGNISHLIQQADLIRILSIPIGRREDLDLIWPLTKHGTFTVKSAYHWFHHMQSTAPINKYGSSHTIDTRCWKLTWKLPTIPKIRHFFWKALNASTPTYLSLYRRKIIKSLLCHVCGIFEESIEHAIFMCPWVDLVIKNFNSKKVRQWVLSLVGWEAASKFMALTNPTAESPMSKLVLNWNPPPMDMIAINCDRSWDIFSLGGKGVVIRNHLGSFMGGLASSVRTSSIEVVEALAILAGVNLVIDMKQSNFNLIHNQSS